MALDNEPIIICSELESYERDETFDEDRNPSWPFASEDDEHRYFDNLQRAADIRSTYSC